MHYHLAMPLLQAALCAKAPARMCAAAAPARAVPIATRSLELVDDYRSATALLLEEIAATEAGDAISSLACIYSRAVSRRTRCSAHSSA